MADLHDALRPSGTPPPPPIEELEVRAHRRKRRRVFRATGAAVAATAVAVSLSGMLRPPQSVTVADGVTDRTTVDEQADVTNAPSQPTTSEQAVEGTQDAPASTSAAAPSSGTDAEGASTSTTTADPDGAAPDPNTPDSIAEPRPRSTPGLLTTVATTSRWEDGYCFQIDLVNDSAEARLWSLTIDIDGTVATIWNAVVVEADEAGASVFAGEDGYNLSIEPGALTTFGACVDTE